MIDCAQIRLETLRTYVRAPFNNHSEPIEPLAQPVDTHFENGCAVVSLQAAQRRSAELGRFTVTPVKEPSEAYDHLSVECNGSSAEKRTLLTVSPADSTDSGVPPSPHALEEDVLSPLPGTLTRFDFKATGHSGPVRAPKFRARSASECLDSRGFNTSQPLARQNSVNSSNDSSIYTPNGTPLRSILKKPKVLPPGMGHTLVLGQSSLKRSKRFVLARSVSECQDDSFRLNVSFDQISLDDLVSMDDLSAPNSPLSVCDESEEFEKDGDEANGQEEDDEEENDDEKHQRTKRVSFNELVQARVYRSSSSILASKNRQERRQQKRQSGQRRRTDSEASEEEQKAPKQRKNDEEFVAPLAGSDEAADLSRRRDSGIDEEEDQDKTLTAPPKQLHRFLSRDSALGDEE
ncbi:unnamed protein product [Bursaphelenchus okinawaensis]|uniref:Uncharacterized protein n=1 Tax=Bursaphelenchus okinawaensis TaxID=465554 RepID=A0A811LF83_9BILA|nr:unnamed protein product [Bursaphelenchus okinawaensis]CAG9122032.1 unnamed protein product [Bursaphelenchus okinawaensis]